MDVLTHARWYAANGISVIPVKADGSKAPAVTGWRKYSAEIADDATLQKWFGGAAPVGVGVPAGPASGNLVVLDFECGPAGSAHTEWYQKLPERLRLVADSLPAVLTPSGGRHLWVRLPDPQPGGKLARYAAGKTKIEIRGEGHQVLAPGCPAECHRSGKLYEWASPPGDGADGRPSFPGLDPDTWAELCEHAAACNEYSAPEQPRDRDHGDDGARSFAPDDSPGSDFNARGTWAEAGLFDAGWTWARQLDGERGFLTRPGKDSGISASVGMVSSANTGYPYLFVWSTSTDFASETPYSRFAVYAHLNHRGDFAAAAKALKQRGYGRQEAAEAAPDLSGFAMKLGTPDGKPYYPFASPRAPADGDRPETPWFKWSSQLAAQEENAKWLWEGYLVRGGITLFSALWKSGKTTLLSHLMKSLDGSTHEFLGKSVTPSRVLYVTEEHEGILADRRDELLIGDHVGWKSQPFDTRPTQVKWAKFIDEACEQVVKHQFDCVVFDTLAKLWPVQEENSATQVDEALLPLWRFTKRHGVAVLLVHHARKSGGSNFTAARGSGALSAFCDILIDFSKDTDAPTETKRRIEATGRYREIPVSRLIELTASGYVCHGDPGDATVKAATRTLPWEGHLVRILESVGDEWLSTNDLSTALVGWQPDKPNDGVRKADILAVLGRMYDGGELEREGSGKGASPYLYRLAQ